MQSEFKEYKIRQEYTRRKSATQQVVKLDEKDKEPVIKKKSNIASPTMAMLVLTGDLSSRLVERFVGSPRAMSVRGTQKMFDKFDDDLRKTQQGMHTVDWRAIYKPLKIGEDSKEHIALAKGKEIKRSKEEARAICLAYIQEFTKENADPRVRAELSDEYTKETFWQRMGIKKVEKEKPLFAVGKDKLSVARESLEATIAKS